MSLPHVHIETATEQLRLHAMIEQAAHYLPTQGPIKVFVHHNTLHAFEHLPFTEGVVEGYKTFGAEPYLSETQYRREVITGRIRHDDIEAALREDLGEAADAEIDSLGTRYDIRLAMLRYPMCSMPERELQWLLAETDAFRAFRNDIDPARIEKSLAATRTFAAEYVRNRARAMQPACADAFQELDAIALPEALSRSAIELLNRTILGSIDFLSLVKFRASEWAGFTLRLLWQVCLHGAELTRSKNNGQPRQAVRPRDRILAETGVDTDAWVHELLIRFTSAFLDQGFSGWSLPNREQGFLHAFIDFYRTGFVVEAPWMRSLKSELKRFDPSRVEVNKLALTIIENELRRMSIPLEQQADFLTETLLALRGWAGMVHQMETSAPWTPKPAPSGSLVQFTAVRLLLDRIAAEYISNTAASAKRPTDLPDGPIAKEQEQLQLHIEGTAFGVFELAQALGWSPADLIVLTESQWSELIAEIDAFSSINRRRVLHAAYERKYRIDALDAISTHAKNRVSRKSKTPPTKPTFQVVTCIDDREESFRRHLEEIEPACQTFGAAGFFAVVMYYRGAAEAHYRPLCPINVVPKHYVVEEPIFSALEENAKRLQRRRVIGKVTQRIHAGSRTATFGVLTGLFGSLATFPLVARILAPRTASRFRDVFSGLVRPPATDLHLERLKGDPGPDYDALGFREDEMAGIVVRILQDIGLVDNFAPIVLFLGHGSSSLNNPHESAYNCGACSGGRGGPNARAFAAMANDPRVRKLVAEAGIEIPEEVRFVGGYHNTCDESVDYYDLDELPRTHHPIFREMEAKINEARCRNAHERCRRFESASFKMSPVAALQHVEERSVDLSQARPEYNHAGNAMCFVGEREWSRGLFLDRRAFLASYDPKIDTPEGKIVERILQAAIPVCGGINLEYYFSTVDPEVYGCGSKLPHNITSLAGVMTGAAGDLRPGLSAQMVEIHEPVRILFVVQTSVEVMRRIIDRNPAIHSLVEGAWVQLALLDAETGAVRHYRHGDFEEYQPETTSISRVAASIDWYRGKRDHLPFAEIIAES